VNTLPVCLIRARSVNCEGPIVPKGVIIIIIIVCETSSKWGETAQFGDWHRKMALQRHLQHCNYTKRMGSFCRTLTKLSTRLRHAQTHKKRLWTPWCQVHRKSAILSGTCVLAPFLSCFHTSHLIELLLHISCYRLQTCTGYS